METSRASISAVFLISNLKLFNDNSLLCWHPPHSNAVFIFNYPKYIGKEGRRLYKKMFKVALFIMALIKHPNPEDLIN